jgi:hypothetical protein
MAPKVAVTGISGDEVISHLPITPVGPCQRFTPGISNHVAWLRVKAAE